MLLSALPDSVAEELVVEDVSEVEPELLPLLHAVSVTAIAAQIMPHKSTFVMFFIMIVLSIELVTISPSAGSFELCAGFPGCFHCLYHASLKNIVQIK